MALMLCQSFLNVDDQIQNIGNLRDYSFKRPSSMELMSINQLRLLEANNNIGIV